MPQVRLLPEGGVIGRVTNLIHAGNDLLEIALAAEQRRVLIPFVEAIVPEVHLDQSWIGLTPPPGLLDLNASPSAARPDKHPSRSAESPDTDGIHPPPVE